MRFTITKIQFDVYNHSIAIEQYPDEIHVRVREYGHGKTGNENWYKRDNPASNIARDILEFVEFTDEYPGTEQVVDGVTKIVEDMI